MQRPPCIWGAMEGVALLRVVDAALVMTLVVTLVVMMVVIRGFGMMVTVKGVMVGLGKRMMGVRGVGGE